MARCIPSLSRDSRLMMTMASTMRATTRSHRVRVPSNMPLAFMPLARLLTQQDVVLAQCVWPLCVPTMHVARSTLSG